jgi:hypothetical protein
MIFAGTPATTALAGTSLVAMAPAAMIALSPIVTPGTTVAFADIHTFFPMTMGKGKVVFRSSGANP